MTNYTNTYPSACKIISTTIKTSDKVLRKIYLSLSLKGLCVRGSWRPNRTATYWPPTLLAITPFLSRSPGLLVFSTASYLQLIWSPNSSDLQLVWSPSDWISCALSYIIVHAHLLRVGVTISHSFNLSTVKVIISWYSSTGCTCYLHRWIFFFDSPSGSEVNIQHLSTGL